MNMIENILAKASGKKEVAPGEVVIANVDLMVMHDLSANFVMRVFREELGGGTILDPSRIAFVFDHNFSPATEEAARTLHKVRQFASEHGITNLFNGGNGSLHHVIIDTDLWRARCGCNRGRKQLDGCAGFSARARMVPSPGDDAGFHSWNARFGSR